MDRDIPRDDDSGRETSREMPAQEARNKPQSDRRPGHAHVTADQDVQRPLESSTQRARSGRTVESVQESTRNQDREQLSRLSQRAQQAALEIGRFRTIAVRDLAREKYGGDLRTARQELRFLKAQGLVQLRTIWAGKRDGKIEFAALTSRGKRLLESDSSSTGQVLYDRFVKPAEILHDAAIYRMYQAERERIEAAGGSIRRVVLDYELKQKAYSPLAKAKGLPPLDYARRQEQIARENGLKVVQGHLVLPDLRIEYEAASGDEARVDLELATEHYRGSQLASKAQAGFKIYAAEASAGRLSSVLEEREITAEILSL